MSGKNRPFKQAIADAIGWKGNVADGDAFVNAVSEFQDKYPGQFQTICQRVLAAHIKESKQ